MNMTDRNYGEQGLASTKQMSLADRLNVSASQAENIVAALSGLANQICGSGPSEVNGRDKPPHSPSFAGLLDESRDRLELAHDAMAKDIDRIRQRLGL